LYHKRRRRPSQLSGKPSETPPISPSRPLAILNSFD
jgi:hypothetical protein